METTNKNAHAQCEISVNKSRATGRYTTLHVQANPVIILDKWEFKLLQAFCSNTTAREIIEVVNQMRDKNKVKGYLRRSGNNATRNITTGITFNVYSK